MLSLLGEYSNHFLSIDAPLISTCLYQFSWKERLFLPISVRGYLCPSRSHGFGWHGPKWHSCFLASSGNVMAFSELHGSLGKRTSKSGIRNVLKRFDWFLTFRQYSIITDHQRWGFKCKGNRRSNFSSVAETGYADALWTISSIAERLPSMQMMNCHLL